MVLDSSVPIRIELDQKCNTLCRFGQLVGSLLRSCILQICPVVLQNLIRASQSNQEGRRVHVNRVNEDANCVTANKSNTKVT